MTDAEFQGRVLAELAAINTRLAVYDERRAMCLHRISALEHWHDEQDNKAEDTAEHEISELRAKLNENRNRWLGWVGKAALLVVGSLLATMAPACSQMVGLG